MSLAGSGRGSLVGVDGGVRFRNPQFYVHQEYAKEADRIVVKTTLDPKTAIFDSIAVRETPGQSSVAMLDVVATRDPAGKQFALFVVNRHLFATVDTTFATNLPAGAIGTRTVLSGPAHDARNDASNPDRVAPQTTPWSAAANFSQAIPPHSLTIYRWTLP
jgi:alpha-L-arabinofuranosidase